MDGKTTIYHILQITPIRTPILQNISAYDAAKLDSLLICILRPKEKEWYLNPARDLIWNISEMEKLLQEGMELALLGDDIPALSQRLHDTKAYLKKYRKRRLTIYLVGMFPVFGKTTEVLDRFVKFNTIGNHSPTRTSRDKLELSRIRWAMELGPDTRFLMAFSAPLSPQHTATHGSWHRLLDVPDKTVDLRIYAPCLEDRVQGVIRLRPVDIARLLGFDTDSIARPLINIIKACMRNYRVPKGSLTISGVQEVQGPAQSRVDPIQGERRLLTMDLLLDLRSLCTLSQS